MRLKDRREREEKLQEKNQKAKAAKAGKMFGQDVLLHHSWLVNLPPPNVPPPEISA